MGTSLKTRLNKIGPEAKEAFIDDCKVWGRSEALSIWSDKLGGYSDYVGLDRFIERETGDANFGKVPTMPVSDNRSVVNLFLEAFENRVVELRNQITERDKRLEQQQRLIDYLQAQNGIENRELTTKLLNQVKEYAST